VVKALLDSLLGRLGQVDQSSLRTAS
jgi:hypothetical protein